MSSSQAKIKKLVEKIRSDIRHLGLRMKVHDPNKLLNVLVMGQQLDIICPIPKVVQPTTPLTPEDILTVPTIPRTKRVRKKLSFGVMSDIQIVSEIEQVIEDEIVEQRETETAQLAEIASTRDITELGTDIQQLQSVLTGKRSALKILKEKKSSEKKEAAKRKATKISEKKKKGKQFKPSAPPVEN